MSRRQQAAIMECAGSLEKGVKNAFSVEKVELERNELKWRGEKIKLEEAQKQRV